MTGTLAVSRPLKYDEVPKFDSHHISMVLDMVQGMRNFEIATKYRFHESVISNLRNHPYTEVIMTAMFSKLADNMTDPIQRIKAYAHEAIEVKLEIMRDAKVSKDLRNRVASDFLDRAGYGARQKLSVEVQPNEEKPSVPNTHLPRIAAALEAAASVRNANYERFVVRPAPQEDEVAGKDLTEEGLGSPNSGSGASHAGPPQPLPVREEKEEKLSDEDRELQEERRAETRVPEGLRLTRVA
jgi:hypothetical protein